MYPYLTDEGKEKGKEEKGSYTYDLYAVSNHGGNMTFGHYWAYCKHPETRKWNNFDDSSVRPMKEKDVCTANGIVLFYRRANLD
jgi:ubiquitin C-terminal hydrolase